MTDLQRQHFERSLNLAIDQLNKEVPFILHKVSSDFCSHSSFSAVDFHLAAHAPGACQVALPVKDLFKVEEVANPAFTSALEFIANSRSHMWPLFTTSANLRETEVMVRICSQILVPLSSEVVLENRYRSILARKRTPVQAGDIGLGSVDTWHGTPDARVRGTDVVLLRASEDKSVVEDVVSEDDVSEEEGSDGATTEVEGKVLATEANLVQAIATCVVASFTAKSRHPEKQALVPTILIDETQFRVCLYDCEKDILLISTSKTLHSKGGLSRSGMALLWLVINHR